MKPSSLYRIILLLFGAAVGFTVIFAGGRDFWTLAAAGMILSVNCILILYRMRTKGEDIPAPPMTVMLILFLAYICGVSLYRGVWSVSSPFFIKFAVYCLAYISAFWFFNKSPKITGIFIICACAGSFVTLFGLFRYLYDVYTEGILNAALSAFFVNKNHFAGYMEMIIPCTAALLFFPLQKSQKALVLYSVILMCAGLAFSMSRGGWISFLIGFIVFGFLLFPVSRKKGALTSAGIVAGAVLLCIAVFYFIGTEPIIRKVESTIDDRYLGMEGRYRIWESSFRSIRENPWLGKGAGTFPYLYQKYRPKSVCRRVAFAHNDYIHILFETGIVGLLFIIIILGERVYPYVLSAYKYYSDRIVSENYDDIHTSSHCRVRFASAVAVAVALTSIVIHSFVDFNLHLSANGILLSMLVGIGMRIGYDIPAEKDGDTPAETPGSTEKP